MCDTLFIKVHLASFAFKLSLNKLHYNNNYLILDSLYSEGNVWLKYSDIKGASNAYQALNNKYFSNRKIICSYVTEQTFHTKIMTG